MERSSRTSSRSGSPEAVDDNEGEDEDAPKDSVSRLGEGEGEGEREREQERERENRNQESGQTIVIQLPTKRKRVSNGENKCQKSKRKQMSYRISAYSNGNFALIVHSLLSSAVTDKRHRMALLYTEEGEI